MNNSGNGEDLILISVGLFVVALVLATLGLWRSRSKTTIEPLVYGAFGFIIHAFAVVVFFVGYGR